MKIQITKDIAFNDSNIPNIKQGEVFILPHKAVTNEYCLVMEYQDRSFFFDKYISLYYNTGNGELGIPLKEGKHYIILDKQRGKISKLTQRTLKLEEDLQVGLF